MGTRKIAPNINCNYNYHYIMPMGMPPYGPAGMPGMMGGCPCPGPGMEMPGMMPGMPMGGMTPGMPDPMPFDGTDPPVDPFFFGFGFPFFGRRFFSPFFFPFFPFFPFFFPRF
ncbi:MAG: hypothetical protein ACYC21_03410 [Eubacteriales bacterium]